MKRRISKDIDVNAVIDRMIKIAGLADDKQLAQDIGYTPGGISNWRTRFEKKGKISRHLEKKVREFVERHGDIANLNEDWVLYGDQSANDSSPPLELSPHDLRRYKVTRGVDRIFDSHDEVIIKAIESNVEAFIGSLDRDKKIADLKMELDELKKLVHQQYNTKGKG